MIDIPIAPAQIRAARALLDLSQADLAKSAGVGLSTVKDAESGKREPIRSNIEAIRATLERAGIVFIPSNGGGPGVRLESHRPQVIRGPTKTGMDYLSFRVAWRNQKVKVFVSTDALDDLGGTSDESDSEYLKVFRVHEEIILDEVAHAIDTNRFDSEGHIRLEEWDFSAE